MNPDAWTPDHLLAGRAADFRPAGGVKSPRNVALTRNQVLKMATREIGGKNHLFIESGGFGPKTPPGWKSTLLVFQPQ